MHSILLNEQTTNSVRRDTMASESYWKVLQKSNRMLALNWETLVSARTEGDKKRIRRAERNYFQSLRSAMVATQNAVSERITARWPDPYRIRVSKKNRVSEGICAYRCSYLLSLMWAEKYVKFSSNVPVVLFISLARFLTSPFSFSLLLQKYDKRLQQCANYDKIDSSISSYAPY